MMRAAMMRWCAGVNFIRDIECMITVTLDQNRARRNNRITMIALMDNFHLCRAIQANQIQWMIFSRPAPWIRIDLGFN